jgi:rod shape determining protein RodA
VFAGLDPGLLLAIAALCGLSVLTMYSSGLEVSSRFPDHLRNMLLAVVLMLTVAQIPPQRFMAIATPVYVLGLVLLIAVALFGLTKKGATRWLNIGIATVQPSEILKIAVPFMLAAWFQKRERRLKSIDFLMGLFLIMVPVTLILKQPDLGTALLITFTGLCVLFFAGLSWYWVLPFVIIGLVGIATIIGFESRLCADEFSWHFLHEYQRQRICTLLDPSSDPLGKGFHIIQGIIAIGAGGLWGRGFLKGTQTHLEFIPEHTTDFIFAAYAEEFGLVGCLLLFAGFILLILRGLQIAVRAPTVFTRLLAAGISIIFFTYACVNVGMVCGILPVVGVPLPFISYGGTAMVTLGLGLGVLMAVSKARNF